MPLALTSSAEPSSAPARSTVRVGDMSNVALVFPLAREAVLQSGVDAKPFVIAVTVAASSSFTSPLGYQTSLMVYGAGGYRFLDFAKIGILLKVLLFIVSMICISYAWPFSSATRPFLNGSPGLDNEDFTSLHLPVFRRRQCSKEKSTADLMLKRGPSGRTQHP